MIVSSLPNIIKLLGRSVNSGKQLQSIVNYCQHNQAIVGKMSQQAGDQVNREPKKRGKDDKKKTMVNDDDDGDETVERIGKNYKAKTPKGMRDIVPPLTVFRRKVFQLIVDTFERYGAEELDTPVCELRETLTGKYGEDAKLIYDLADQGGEILSLRYDLTVPFSRYLAQHKISNMDRYQISKVYRRDNPSITKGRFREFYQCDFDIAGQCDSMIAESECLSLISDVLNDLDLKSFVIKVNHRQLLSGMFTVAGVPEEKFKTICSSIDKLGKNTWEEIKEEMCKVKGLEEAVADRIGELIKYHGSIEMLEELLAGELGKCDASKEGLEGLKVLYWYCKDQGIEDNIEFDLSLARGLDYYTGVIYEAVLKDDGLEVGSIAAGGRYDTLVSLLTDNKHNVPCVGVSIGIERIFAIIEQRMSSESSIAGLQCFVVSIGKGMAGKRLNIVRELRRNGIRANHLRKSNPKLLSQIETAEKKNVPFIVMFGENELKEGIVKIRDVKTRAETPIERSKLIDELKARLGETKK